MFPFSNLMRNLGRFDPLYLVPIITKAVNYYLSEGTASTTSCTLMSLANCNWDSLNIAPNWTTCFQVLLLFLFSLTSVNMSHTCPPPNNTPHICLQFGYFSPQLFVLLLGSLIFPPPLFFYAYPAVLIPSRFLSWFNLRRSALPVLKLHISSTLTPRHHHEDDGDDNDNDNDNDNDENDAEIDIEAQVPEPEEVVQIAPEDLVEA